MAKKKVKCVTEFMAQYPEHEKLQAVRSHSQVIGEFLDWLEQEKKLRICYLTEGRLQTYEPSNFSREALLGEFLGISPKKLEAEKQAMLKEIRKANKQK